LQPRIRNRGVSAWALVLVLIALVGANVAVAATKGRAASIHVTAPGSITRGGAATITVTGYSGPYNEVAVSLPVAGKVVCKSPGSDSLGMQAVTKNKTFKVNVSNVYGAPGTLTACAYLYTAGSTNGKYIAKSAHLKVS